MNPPIEESLLESYFRAMGPYGLWLLLSFVVSLLLTVLLFIRGRGYALPAALLLVVPLPLIVGGIALGHGLIQSYDVIARSPVEPDMIEVSPGFSLATVSIVTALSCTQFIGFIAVIFAVIRLIGSNRNS